MLDISTSTSGAERRAAAPGTYVEVYMRLQPVKAKLFTQKGLEVLYVTHKRACTMK